MRQLSRVRQSDVDVWGWFRRIVTVTLLGLIFHFYIDFPKLLAALYTVDLRYYVVALVVSIISILVSVRRWQVILRYYDININYWTLTKIYMVSIFYNLTLPGSLGGDVVKAYRIAEQGGDRGKLIGSVPLERIAGLIALFPVLLIGLIFSQHILPQRIIIIVGIACFVSLFGIFALSSEVFNSGLMWLLDRPIMERLGFRADIRSMVTTLQALRSPAFVSLSVGYSIVYVVLALIVNYFFVQSIGLEISFLYLAAVIPIQQILIQIPISVGGIGINEGVLIFFLALVGISPESAVLISLLNYVTQLTNSLIGGLIDIT